MEKPQMQPITDTWKSHKCGPSLAHSTATNLAHHQYIVEPQICPITGNWLIFTVQEILHGISMMALRQLYDKCIQCKGIKFYSIVPQYKSCVYVQESKLKEELLSFPLLVIKGSSHGCMCQLCSPHEGCQLEIPRFIIIVKYIYNTRNTKVVL